MNQKPNNYKAYMSNLDKKAKNKDILHTVYLSRRAIWANVLLSFLLASLAAYIHTRRWKQMGIFSISLVAFMTIISSDSDSLEESFRKGQKFSPLASLIATIDNSIAIKKARKKVNNENS